MSRAILHKTETGQEAHQAPLTNSAPIPSHEPVWTLDVKHGHSNGRFEIDTHITLLKPRNPGPWLIEKRLDELPGHFPPPALMVAGEKAMITKLTAMELPVAPLGTGVALESGGNDDPYCVMTVYGGPSVPEILRHPLPQVDYAAVFYAVLVFCYQRLAAMGVLPLDSSPRNVVIELSGVRTGHLMFKQAWSIDHAHTIVAGQAESQRVPHIGLPEGSAPEVVQLLEHEFKQLLNEALPSWGCCRKRKKSYVKPRIEVVAV